MKPSLDEFIAALPNCPDCGEKLHSFAFCPGRSRIRPEAMQDPTQTEKEGTTMTVSTLDIDRSLKNRTAPSDPIIAAATADVKDPKVTTLPAAKPSPSRKIAGGKRATTKAQRERAAAKEVAKQKAAGQKRIDGLAKKMTGGAKPKAAKPAAKRGTGNGSGPAARVTDVWTSAKRDVEVLVGSTVKAPGIGSLTIVGRWSKRRKDGTVIPFVTGTTPDGTRKNVAAADCTVVKAPAKK